VFGDGDVLLGAVHIDVSLSGVLAGSIAGLGDSESASLLDRGGTTVASARTPSATAVGSPDRTIGGAVLSTEAIVGREWRIAVAAPSALAGPSLTLIALLVLAVVLIARFIVLMARQVLRPAEELEASRARLHDLWELARVDSLRDLLTGLGNHRAFQEEMGRQVDTARRYGAPLAITTLDLDDFQAVNDEIGHARGDEVLAAFGQLIGHSLRFADRAFRTGGDEFALLLPHTDAAGAETVVRRLLSNALEPPRGRELSRAISFSAGISSVPALAGDKRQLIGQAEAALAGAKRAGRMAIEVYDPARHRGAGVPLDLGALSANVAETVARRLLRPVYQPIVDLRSGKVVGYEGLIRPLPGSSFTDTGALFEAAAKTGRTVELDHACLEIVAAGARELGRDGWLTMNVSPRTLEVPDFSPAALVRVVAAAGLEPARIVLELTERETVEEVERLRRNVAACRESGFRVAADDVGSGNAGLRLLSQLQFDIVKIDLSLVQEGALHETSLAVVGSLQELARRWGASVIAEGIETPEQLRVVRELDIAAGQGYLLGRPGKAEDLATIAMTAVDLDALLGSEDWLGSLARATPAFGVGAG
jgi:diguanylate cyclase (GGDEF)-like protein